MFSDIKCFFKDLISKIKKRHFSVKTPFIIILCIVLLLIPTLTAIWHVYFRSSGDFGSSSDITISFYDLKQNKELFSEEINEKNISDSHTADMFYNLRSENKLSSPPENAPKEPNYRISILFENSSAQFLCYFSENHASSYLSDGSGNLYSVDRQKYASFLSSIYSDNAYSTATPPLLLTENNVSITPQTVNWNFKKTNNTFETSQNNVTTSQRKTYQMHNSIVLSFSVQPSSCEITIFEKSDDLVAKNEIYKGDLSGLGGITVESGTNLLFSVKASWKDTDFNIFYGDILYEFEVECTEHASFELNASKVSQGEFLILSLHSEVDSSAVKYEVHTSDKDEKSIFSLAEKQELLPAQKKALEFLKEFKPQFASNGEGLFAFLPIPINTPEGTLTFSLSSGIATKTFTIEVTERNSQNLYPLNTTMDTIINVISDKAISETANVFEDVAEGRAITELFGSSFQHPLPNISSTSYVFGDKFLINETPIENLISFGNFYAVPDTSFHSVSSIGAGSVIFTGQTQQLGNFAVVDHGMGLYSWYCNLSVVDVRQGDIVSENQQIGKTGLSPLSTQNGTFFICTIYGCVIDPALILNKQIVLE